MSRFLSQVVVDETGTPLASAAGWVYDIADVSNTTPLELTDNTGAAIPLDQLLSNNDGVTPEFTTDRPLVKWVSGDYTVGMIAWDLIPAGGDAGALLAKASSDSYDLQWVTGGSGGGGATINVKTFGATGDGTTDDTTSIQAALNAVPAGGCGVLFPAGDYVVSAPLRVETDGTMLLGEGAGNRFGGTQFSVGSRIRATTGITGQIIKVQRAANDRPLQGVHIKDLTIEGDLQGTDVDGILFRSNGGTIDRVHIWQCSGAGLRVMGQSSPSWDTYDTRFSSLLIGNNVGDGVVLDTRSADTHWSHCILLNNYDNLVNKGASGQFTSCHFYTPERHNIRFDLGGSRSKFVNCKIEGAKNHSVILDSTNGGTSDVQFTGCGWSSHNSSTPTNTYDYVHITGPSNIGTSRTTFVGNSFNLKGGSVSKARYAISLENSSAQGTVIIGNSFGPASHWGTAAINDSGSSSFPATIKANANVPDASGASVFLNVADFGAKGNGSTDDTVAVQAALDAADPHGSIVWFPPGIYQVSAPLIVSNDNIHLRGAGAGSRSGSYPGEGSRISADPVAVFSGPIVQIKRVLGDRPVYAPKMADLAIDARSAVGASSAARDALSICAVKGDFDNVSVWAASGDGVVLKGIDASNNSSQNRFRSVVSSNHANGTGFLVDTQADDNLFSLCIAENNGTGVKLVSSRTSLIGCDINTNVKGVFMANAGNQSRFLACKIRGSETHGVQITTSTAGISEASFVSCQFADNGNLIANTYDHMNVFGSSSFAISRLQIVACSFTSTNVNKPRFGVYFADSSVQGAMVVANMFGSTSHFASGPIQDSSSSSVKNLIKSNINVPDVVPSTTVTGPSTLEMADAGTFLDVNSATAVNITIPPNSTVAFPTGTTLKLTQISLGQITLVAGAGVTINSAVGLKSRTQYSVINLRKRATNVWVAWGDMSV